MRAWGADARAKHQSPHSLSLFALLPLPLALQHASNVAQLQGEVQRQATQMTVAQQELAQVRGGFSLNVIAEGLDSHTRGRVLCTQLGCVIQGYSGTF